MASAEDRRARTRETLDQLLALALERLRGALDANRASDARSHAITVGILFDKLQLSVGEPTQILRGLEEARAQLPALLQRLARSTQPVGQESS